MRLFSQRRFHIRWAFVLTVVMLMSLAGPAMAVSPQPLSFADKIEVLRQFQIVRGDQNGDLNLDKPITRAEMVTIVVRAIGKDSEAGAHHGLGLFSDSKGHWADGYLSYGRTIGLVKGDGDGTVRPDDPISYAESLTLVLRTVGKEPTTGEWPSNVLMAALDLQLLPTGVTYATLSEPAIRGLIFGSLADALINVTTSTGVSYLQEYLKPQGPALTLDPVPAETNGDTVVIKGRASGALTVTINGAQVALSDGSFQMSLPLKLGSNQVNVVATDRLGVATAKQITVSRLMSVARLEIDGPGGVALGASATYTITAFDAAGNLVEPVGVSATIEGGIGTFDVKTGKLTASNQPATGRIVLTLGSVSASTSVKVSGLSDAVTELGFGSIAQVAYTKPLTVQVEARDEDGNLVDDDNGRIITLTASGLSGLTVSPSSASTSGGVATFTVRATEPGEVTLAANSNNLGSVGAVAQFGTTTRVVLTTDQTNFTVGSGLQAVRIKAELRDEEGKAITNNTGEDILVEISAAGSDGSVDDAFLTIRRGTSNSTTSGDDGLYSIGSVTGTVTVSGKVFSSHNYSVDSARLTIGRPSTGSGAKFSISAPYPKPEPGETGLYIIRATDAQGNAIGGNYAFQVKVTTSNGESDEELANSLTVSLGGTGLSPVSDGKAEGSTDDGPDVIGRTDYGTALLEVTYDKPGIVTVTVMGAGATTLSYNDKGEDGTAQSGSGLQSASADGIWYTTPTKVRLVAESDGFGKDQPIGATSNRSRPVTIVAYLTDDYGHWIPETTGTVTLSFGAQREVTAGGNLKATATNGKAQFTIHSTSRVGSDTYTASAEVKIGNTVLDPIHSDPITIQVDSKAPATNGILFARGGRDGMSGAENYVAPDDEYLELELTQDTNEKWVIVKVFAENSSSPIYTSRPIDLSEFAPKVHVPKSNLRSGVVRYSITVRNGFGDSPRSGLSSQITNGAFSTGVKLTGARYDAVKNELTITGSGFSTNVNDVLDPGLLTIVDPFNMDGTESRLTLYGAYVKDRGISSSAIVLDVSGVPGIADLADGTQFSGTDVRIVAEAGWYTRSNGQIAEANLGSNAVTPMAYIAHAELNRANNRLTLVGAGFNTSTFDWKNVKLSDETALSTFSNTKSSDSRWVFTLSAAKAKDIEEKGLTLKTLAGWSKSSGASQEGMTGIPVYQQITFGSVTYRVDNKGTPNDTTDDEGVITIKGSGFLNGTVDTSKMTIVDVSTKATIDLSAATASGTSSELVIRLTPQQTQDYQVRNNTPNVGFMGSDIYIQAKPGWFVFDNGPEAAPIMIPTLRMPTK